ncbi:MAG: tRNA pseudouridine(55) synthase TruB [Planctomycetes bacterium]|nr:tRNA pseudouridine(55) synthase TruB [Planctomycetota bacterium]
MPTPVIDGFVNLNKPAGITSAKALYKVRSASGMRKSGHSGTLDPQATGVLVICVGKATKMVECLMDHPKVYRATARLDVTSVSLDSDSTLQPVDVQRIPEHPEIEAALAEFEGEQEQLPPAVSALKIGGVPAYKLVRDGVAPKLKPRNVTIYWTTLLDYEWPVVSFEMACGRGTYVRSVIRDLGEKFGCGGCLTDLVRVQVGPFHVDDAWTLDRLQTASAQDYILPLARMDEALRRTPVAIPPRPT